MSSVVLVEKSDGIATVTLNRPDVLNALNRELQVALTAAIHDLAQDDAIRVVILTGAGRAFCAGVDLKELGQKKPGERRGEAGREMVVAFSGFEKPIIGAINGFAITGGLEIAIACDVRIASSAAKFGDTHARVGILSGWGLSQLLPRLIGVGRAKEMSLTGNFVGAEQAERWGLVNRVVAPEELMPACRALAEDMLSCDAQTLVRYKQVIDEGFAMNYGDARVFEDRASREYMGHLRDGSVEDRRRNILERGRSQRAGGGT